MDKKQGDSNSNINNIYPKSVQEVTMSLSLKADDPWKS